MHLPDRCKELPQAAPRQVLAAATLAPASVTLAPASRAARSRGNTVITLWFQSILRASFKIFFEEWTGGCAINSEVSLLLIRRCLSHTSVIGVEIQCPVCIASPGRDVHPRMYPHRHWNMAVLRCQGTPFPKSYRGWVRPELVLGGGGKKEKMKWSRGPQVPPEEPIWGPRGAALDVSGKPAWGHSNKGNALKGSTSTNYLFHFVCLNIDTVFVWKTIHLFTFLFWLVQEFMSIWPNSKCAKKNNGSPWIPWFGWNWLQWWHIRKYCYLEVMLLGDPAFSYMGCSLCSKLFQPH